MSTCSAASAASHSQRGGQTSKQSASPKSTHTPAPSSGSTGPTSQTSETSQKPTSGPTQEQLFSPEVSLASRSALPGSKEARAMTVSSGLACSRLLPQSSPLGSLVKTLLASSAWNSTACLLTWKAKATPRFRLLFQLAPSMPGTEETEFGLWQTPVADDSAEREKGKFNSRGEPKLSAQVKLWPTPTVCEVEKNLEHYQERRARPRATKGGGDGPNLATAVKLLPTPKARDYRTGDNPDSRRAREKQSGACHSPDLNDVAAPSGQLNPEFVEWLMGYPAGWTELKDSEMPSSRRSRSESSAESLKSKG